MTALSDLIARLEVATEGSRELDAQIAAEVHIAPENAPGWLVNWTGPFVAEGDRVIALHSDGHRSANWNPEAHTTSLDAAIRLVPEGWCWAVLKLSDDAFSAGLQKPPNAPLLTDDEWPSPALALCIAALKARQ